MILRQAVLAIILLGTLAATAAAEPVNVVLGGTDCFVIRVPDGDTSPAERSTRIRDVFERSRGREPGRFTIRAEGPRRLIFLDGDFLVAVTPADAQATHHESAATLAPVWRDRLRLAWEAERSDPAGATAASPRGTVEPFGGEALLLFVGLLVLAIGVVILVLLRQGRQMTTLMQDSAEWRREVSEALAQPKALAALPAAEGETLPAALQDEVIRVAREESQAAVNEAVQRICDSVERVMAGLLEEMARGMSRPPGSEGGSGISFTGTPEPREPALAGRGRSGGESNGGAPDGTDAASAAETGASPLRHGPSESSARRGPVTLEIAAFGKTYAFPMASERGREVLATWEAGGAVPESWLHESGITTARLQPLLERFVLRRHLEADGSLSYLLDTRGGAVRIALRNVG